MIYITLLFGIIVFSMYTYLSFKIIKFRRVKKIPLNDGGNKRLSYLIGAQVNLVEYSFFFLFFLMAAELNRVTFPFLLFCGALFMIGRILHMYAFVSMKDGKYSSLGMKFTIWSLITIIIGNVIQVFIIFV